jgi:hypothetical protein
MSASIVEILPQTTSSRVPAALSTDIVRTAVSAEHKPPLTPSYTTLFASALP